MPPETTEQQSDAAKSKRLELADNGDVYQMKSGNRIVVAHYDEETRHLEFATREYSAKLYQQVLACVGSTDEGRRPSQNVVRSFGVKGEKKADISKAPKRPRFGELGDCTKEVVEWYFEHNLPEAIVRYGVYVDRKGNPIRRNVERKSVEVHDRREKRAKPIPEEVKVPGGSWENGPIQENKFIDQFDNQIIARRATHMTFTPSEVIGGFQHDDDDSVPVAASDEEGGDQ
jgi:hypothetical protein